MAIATTCPQCKTSFKVVAEQLKLRRGLVRCGICQHIFSGVDYLRYVDDRPSGTARQNDRVSEADKASEVAAAVQAATQASFQSTLTRDTGPSTTITRAPHEPRQVGRGDRDGDRNRQHSTDRGGDRPIDPGTLEHYVEVITPVPPAPPDLRSTATLNMISDPYGNTRSLPPPAATSHEGGHDAAGKASPGLEAAGETTPTLSSPLPSGDDATIPDPITDGSAPPDPASPDASAQQWTWPDNLAPSETGRSPSWPSPPQRPSADAGSSSPFLPTAPSFETILGPMRHDGSATADDRRSLHVTVERRSPNRLPDSPSARPAAATLTDDEIAALAAAAGRAKRRRKTTPNPPDKRRTDARNASRGGDRSATRRDTDSADWREPTQGLGGIRIPGEPSESRQGTVRRPVPAPAPAEPVLSLLADEPPVALRAGGAGRWTLRIAAAILAATLAGQCMLRYREPLADALPMLRPAIAAMARPFGLHVPASQKLVIDSFDIMTDPGRPMLLMILLRNADKADLPWPTMHLILKDARDNVVVRRTLTPSEYLRPDAPSIVTGFSEQQIQLSLDPKATQPAGYSIKLYH